MLTAVNHITTISSTDEGLAIAILLLVAGTFVSLLCAHLVDRGVSPIRDAVSDFGAREHPWFYRVAAIWLGLAGLLTAVLLGDAVFPKPTITILSLLVFAAARWAITIFPTDLEGEEETSVGRAHVVLAVVAFTALPVAAIAFAFTTAALDPFWKPHGFLFTVVAGTMVGAALATAASRVNRSDRFGLNERLLYLTMFAWFALVAIVALTG